MSNVPSNSPSLSPLRLTEWTSCGGCAAKWGATLLADLVSDFPASLDPALLVGLAPFDDAAVYQVSDDVALVSTTDFFPPLVDDPGDFGAIAAANACSDVFAMGGRVVMAVNIAAFPEHFPPTAIAQIFAAAALVVAEAGGSIAGGHTIRNPEPIFGLAVQGVVNPQSFGAVVHAVTDVTGYGLAGHGWEMAERSAVALVIDAGTLQAYPGAREAAQRGVRTGGDPRNRDYVEGNFVDAAGNDAAAALCFDPQTSGGLLAAVDAPTAAALLKSGAWWRAGCFVGGAVQISLQ